MTPVTRLRKSSESSTRDLAAFLEVPHSRLLAKVRRLEQCQSQQVMTQNFWPSSYTDSRGRQRPQYQLTRDGFLLLVMCCKGPRATSLMLAFLEQFKTAEQTALEYGLHTRPYEIEDFTR